MPVKQSTVLRATEGRQRFFSLIHQVEREGKTFLFEYRGKPIAVLTSPASVSLPPPDEERKRRMDVLRRIREFHKRLNRKTGDAVEIIQKMREARAQQLAKW